MLLVRDRSQQKHTILEINIIPEKISLNHTPHKIYYGSLRRIHVAANVLQRNMERHNKLSTAIARLADVRICFPVTKCKCRAKGQILL